ncbi:cation-translocating P-type ATPase [Lacrimispora saccharolytica]|uniref:ATPase, P-type (Transporting), HAD superfamily, subfamily IC n=1 Tax=Lacrimispora saccharolytica (strain ATCC 35040 / DSM 2544 / NRCC 2533 / WM1) TaxID=610130 RepID=D9R2I9_LACSW|nr:cation-translocating P-type ATPase [Lacrimispora saccharolytica]ADL06613.1 ATPase, P-type (transporting), HAD superfamily, subfamily IC [[Clostridium] saccharolyticum WM1]QRV19314.1 cation-translocating P-type ATPase [Lacrimispora saccharolytica]
MEEWFRLSEDEALAKLGAGRNGLDSREVLKRRQLYGPNTLKKAERKNAFQVFLDQFKDLLVIILIIAAVISMISGDVESTGVIFAVLLLNAVLGTVEHQKAEKSLDSLMALSSPVAKVIREGRKQEILSSEIVPGDILLLEAGDMVAADSRILENYSLLVNESSLTGESVNVEKRTGRIRENKVPLAEQANMVFSGSLVAAGRAIALVTGTGMDTEIGRIASLMNDTGEKKTPLQVSLDQFGSRLAAGILFICAVIFGLSIYRRMPVLDSLMFAVALAVAAIPEALSSIVTIVQAMGTQKMAGENAIIKDLKAVESLGCVSVICSDKTGTLTQNRMTVQQIYVNSRLYPPELLNKEVPVHKYLLYDAVLNNDSAYIEGKLIGDPTEAALVQMAERAGMEEEALKSYYPRAGEVPFDSQRKLMSTMHRIEGKRILFTKGAVDVLLPRISHIWTGEGVRPIKDGDRQALMEQNMEFSKQGLRVLTFACREMDEDENLTEKSESGCIFLGMTAMMDPPRPETRNAVLNARRAGIRPVMITGDHKITASAIAEKIGILGEDDLAVSGPELDDMPEEELSRRLERISVYARVSPEHKIRIVRSWQKKGHIVAMTGDGVNDAPALKQADIGVAMGKMGTEVSKDASAMILTDDNFATIIKAVANGRNVYRNIRNAIKFLLSGNMAGILCVLYTSLLALPTPFAPVHLLFINLLTDSLPAIAIGMEKAEADLLAQKPRNPKEGILTKRFVFQILLQGALIAVCTMTSYHTGLVTGSEAAASTMAFSTLTLARLFHGFNCRSGHSILKIGFQSNLWSIMAFEAGAVLLGAVLFIPGLHTFFYVADLTVRQLITIFIFAIIPTLVIQAFKTVRESLH